MNYPASATTHEYVIPAGITAYAAPLNHYDVVVERRDGKLLIRPNIRLGAMRHAEQEIALKGNTAYLRISSDKDYYYLQFSSDNRTYTTLAKMDFRYLSTEVIGGFTGVMLGLFSQNGQTDTTGYFDIDWFEYITK